MGDDVVLHAVRLTKEYGRGAALVRAVDEVDLDVVRGESVAIMGPSGCGKSTLLHLLGGLERPTRGELTLAGARVDGLGETGLAKLRRHAIGFVFQGFHLVEELTAVENVEMPALLSGTSPREARKRALELLDRTGLGDRAKHLPSELSGGQRQRVAVARALVGRPQLVLADEPTGNLDSAATVEVLRLFDGLRARRPDAGHRHPRRSDRRGGGPADLHARRVLRGRDQGRRRHARRCRLARRTGGLSAWGDCCSSCGWPTATCGGTRGRPC